jgi:hypothetical protein
MTYQVARLKACPDKPRLPDIIHKCPAALKTLEEQNEGMQLQETWTA